MEHIGLFGIIVNLILATWCAVYVAQTKKTTDHRVLSPLLIYSICYILLVFLLLVYLYLTLNLSLNAVPKLLQDLGLMGICVLEIMMIYAMLGIFLAFQAKKLSRGLRMGFWTGLVIFIISFGPKYLDVSEKLKTQLHSIHYFIFDNVIILEVIILLLLLIRARKIADPDRARLARAFAVMYLSRYFLPVTVGLIVHLISPLPRALKMILALALFIYCSFVPILWIRWYLLNSTDNGRMEIGDGSSLNRIIEEHGISQREREILELLLMGKSHRDIEEELFISYHTVKNHIYNLYQKLGVKNRHQLFHLFSRSDHS